MHRDFFILQDVSEVTSGEICALFGLECSSGDTFTDGSVLYAMVMFFHYIELKYTCNYIHKFLLAVCCNCFLIFGPLQSSMHVPKPVISLAVEPKNKNDGDKMGKALQRFVKEDPTFRVHVDEESSQTIISVIFGPPFLCSFNTCCNFLASHSALLSYLLYRVWVNFIWKCIWNVSDVNITVQWSLTSQRLPTARLLRLQVNKRY